MPARSYIAIDLKSFYASVECMERGLDPLTTHLVVADPSRTEKTICLAVSPSLKAHGIPGRARYFEVIQKVHAANALRRQKAPRRRFTGESSDALELAADPSLAISYLTAVPRMALYIEYSTRVYSVYLKYFSPDDIHVYSIDEVFIDATSYLKNYRTSIHELTKTVILDVLRSTGITATAGIGTNLYLAKVAMDIMAKKVAADEDGVRIACLDEMSYRQQLWHHTPLRDFWRVGRGYVQKLEKYGIKTMGDIARYSIHSEDLLFRLFGVNAELLIDHAWGYEPCTMADIKAYQPKANSISNSQILFEDYSAKDAYLILKEMVDSNVLTLTEKHLVTDHISLFIGYSKDVRKPSRGSCKITNRTNSYRLLMEEFRLLYQKIVDVHAPIRQIGISFGNVQDEINEQYDLFANIEDIEKERKLQKTLVFIRNKYGKNSVLKGMNYLEKGTARYRNTTIGGHKA